MKSNFFFILFVVSVHVKFSYAQGFKYNISEEEAIKIAKKHNCYKENYRWTNNIKYNEQQNTWTVSSTRKKELHPPKTFHSKMKYWYIIIDAEKGSIIKKHKPWKYKKIYDFP